MLIDQAQVASCSPACALALRAYSEAAPNATNDVLGKGGVRMGGQRWGRGAGGGTRAGWRLQIGKGCSDFLADHLADGFMGWLKGLVVLLGVLFAHLGV